MLITMFCYSLRASSPIWASLSRLARLALLAQIGKLGRRLVLLEKTWGLYQIHRLHGCHFKNFFQACAFTLPVTFLTGDHVNKTDLSSFVDKRSGYEFPYVCVLVLVVSIQFITLRRSHVKDHVDTLVNSWKPFSSSCYWEDCKSLNYWSQKPLCVWHASATNCIN